MTKAAAKTRNDAPRTLFCHFSCKPIFKESFVEEEQLEGNLSPLYKHPKNCECCPLSLLISRHQVTNIVMNSGSQL